MKMRRALFAVVLSLFAVFSFGQAGFGAAEKINGDWKFMLSDVEEGEKATVDDSRWQTVQLPHDWSVRQQLSPTLASCAGYLPGGIGWYRKTVQVPATSAAEKVYLYFEGVYNRSEVYVNGHLLGKRPNGYISFLYDATPYIRPGEENLIAVRVDHSRAADSRWYTGSGIYRDVWMINANPLHIAQWGVYAYPSVATAKRGVLDVEVQVTNDSEKTEEKITVLNELFDNNDRLVAIKKSRLAVNAGENATVKSALTVKNPQLWSLDDPTLYRLRTTILNDGQTVDLSETMTGFRTYTFDPDKGFALNGEWMKVKGVCLHHDGGVLGAAVHKDVWKRRLLNLKEIGCNAIRTSHNPQDPDLYALCDELGLLVMNEAFDEWEFPKRKWLEGWNVGTPGFEGSYDFFEEWGEQDLADMVRRDRNHISVFAWSIGNEVDYPNDPYSHPVLDGGAETGFTQPIFGGYRKDAPDANRLGVIARRLAAVVRKYDPSRLVTAGLAGVAMSNETDYPGALDIAGYNYTEGMYDADHKKYPNRVIYGSENRHELSAWKHTRDKEYIFGQFLWTGIDYLGESGRWPSRGFYSGLLDFGGFIKPRGYFRQSLWSSQPMAYLGTYPTPGSGSGSQMRDVWSQLDAEQGGNYVERAPSLDAWPIWNYREGQSVRVVSYTNAPMAKLLLNGKEVGKVQAANDDHGVIFWDIPYEQGLLTVVGLDDDNREIVRHDLRSSGRPKALKIISEEQVITPDGIAQIIVQVVDEEGVPVMLSDDEVTCMIAGNGRLLGLEASNNADMSDYTDHIHRVFHGRMVAYIAPNGAAGEAIKVRFTAPWLDAAETTVRVR